MKQSRRFTTVVALLLCACAVTPAPTDGAIDGATDDACARITIDLDQDNHVDACGAELVLDAARVVEIASDAPIDLGGTRASYFPPTRMDADVHVFHAEQPAIVHVRDHGPPIDEVRIDRSLTWTDATLLDDPRAAGLARLMRVVAGDRAGIVLEAWFERFATTAHSERVGPTRFLEEARLAQGDDPSAWDLDALPFRVTAVHNRIDLRDGAHCGELRVSLASVHPIHQPFHLIFLFQQPATERDVGADGTVHCAATARRWAALSALDDDAFRDAARAWLDEALVRDRLLVIESLDFLISPWEWRQWFLEESGVLDNRPLFQTVDTPRLNAPGPDRDAFLAWVEANAASIDARRAIVPERFRSASARVNDGVPWIPLDLSGADASVLSAYPALRQRLEIVGCPACHATDADFVQTLPDRSFSPFYVKELDARAAHLIALTQGSASLATFGPLQRDPLLPP